MDTNTKYVETSQEESDREKNFTYHRPIDDQPARYQQIRDYASGLAELINNQCPASRERSLAMTKLEEAVMWANAAIARNE